MWLPAPLSSAQREADLSELEASVVYLLKSRVARAAQWHLITPKKTKEQKQKQNKHYTHKNHDRKKFPLFFPFSVLGQISTFLSLSTQYRSKFITHI